MDPAGINLEIRTRLPKAGTAKAPFHTETAALPSACSPRQVGIGLSEYRRPSYFKWAAFDNCIELLRCPASTETAVCSAEHLWTPGSSQHSLSTGRNMIVMLHVACAGQHSYPPQPPPGLPPLHRPSPTASSIWSSSASMTGSSDWSSFVGQQPPAYWNAAQAALSHGHMRMAGLGQAPQQQGALLGPMLIYCWV